MALNIDHKDAVEAVDAAYQLLLEFEKTIESHEDDHPVKEAVDKWLTWYEQNDR